MAENMELGYELDWNGYVEHDSTFEPFPAGDYDFEVVAFERGRHDGSEKLPPCNKATMSIKLIHPDGRTAIIKHNLFLHSVTEGMLCSFFVSIGLRKHKEKFNLAGKFEAAVGRKGRCKVYIDTWTGRDKEEMKSNKIKYFYDPEELQQPKQEQAQQTGWKL